MLGSIIGSIKWPSIILANKWTFIIAALSALSGAVAALIYLVICYSWALGDMGTYRRLDREYTKKDPVLLWVSGGFLFAGWITIFLSPLLLPRELLPEAKAISGMCFIAGPAFLTLEAWNRYKYYRVRMPGQERAVACIFVLHVIINAAACAMSLCYLRLP